MVVGEDNGGKEAEVATPGVVIKNLETGALPFMPTLVWIMSV